MQMVRMSLSRMSLILWLQISLSNLVISSRSPQSSPTNRAYDRDDTFRPPGQLNEVAQEVALAKGNTLIQNARLFALLNIAQADAGIVAWDAKYTYEQLRPITAIQEADKDNNPDTIADPNWEPLLDTPPFPQSN